MITDLYDTEICLFRSKRREEGIAVGNGGRDVQKAAHGIRERSKPRGRAQHLP
jgi:hypothetical protein